MWLRLQRGRDGRGAKRDVDRICGTDVEGVRESSPLWCGTWGRAVWGALVGARCGMRRAQTRARCRGSASQRGAEDEGRAERARRWTNDA
mmetsp:Transcript_3150/g.8783  ORF Transcript_3150/g.8783 Transcript_3150/m.8783 type:complete len:90 (-) Transcript_3150:753-1022(-)